jgi:hypothetical protein
MRALHVWRAQLDAGEWPSAAEWAEREAIAKCHGTGLWAPLPDAAVSVVELDAGPDHAAAVAVAGERMPPIEQFEAKPRASAQ